MKATGLKKGSSVKYLDYTIKNCLNNDGIVLLKEDGELYESHLGNFSSLESAKKYAVANFMVARPSIFHASVVNRMLDKSGTMHDYYSFKKACEDENIELPDDIKHSGGMNCVITLVEEPEPEKEEKMVHLCRVPFGWGIHTYPLQALELALRGGRFDDKFPICVEFFKGIEGVIDIDAMGSVINATEKLNAEDVRCVLDDYFVEKMDAVVNDLLMLQRFVGVADNSNNPQFRNKVGDKLYEVDEKLGEATDKYMKTIQEKFGD